MSNTQQHTPGPWRVGRDMTRLGTFTVTNGIKTYYKFRKAEAQRMAERLNTERGRC